MATNRVESNRTQACADDRRSDPHSHQTRVRCLVASRSSPWWRGSGALGTGLKSRLHGEQRSPQILTQHRAAFCDDLIRSRRILLGLPAVEAPAGGHMTHPLGHETRTASRLDLERPFRRRRSIEPIAHDIDEATRPITHYHLARKRPLERPVIGQTSVHLRRKSFERPAVRSSESGSDLRRLRAIQPFDAHTLRTELTDPFNIGDEAPDFVNWRIHQHRRFDDEVGENVIEIRIRHGTDSPPTRRRPARPPRHDVAGAGAAGRRCGQAAAALGVKKPRWMIVARVSSAVVRSTPRSRLVIA
jgi:hypothetical protein